MDIDEERGGMIGMAIGVAVVNLIANGQRQHCRRAGTPEKGYGECDREGR